MMRNLPMITTPRIGDEIYVKTTRFLVLNGYSYAGRVARVTPKGRHFYTLDGTQWVKSPVYEGYRRSTDNVAAYHVPNNGR